MTAELQALLNRNNERLEATRQILNRCDRETGFSIRPFLGSAWRSEQTLPEARLDRAGRIPIAEQAWTIAGSNPAALRNP